MYIIFALSPLIWNSIMWENLCKIQKSSKSLLILDLFGRMETCIFLLFPGSLSVNMECSKLMSLTLKSLNSKTYSNFETHYMNMHLYLEYSTITKTIVREIGKRLGDFALDTFSIIIFKAQIKTFWLGFPEKYNAQPSLHL